MTRRSLALRSLLPVSLALASAHAAGGCSDDAPLPAKPGGEIIRAATPPPAISGGTLAVSEDGRVAVAADPDRDRIFVVDLAGRALRAEIPLEKGDEPGRVALDGEGRAHVALRAGGAVATVDLEAGKLLRRTAVCAAPRGVAHEPATGALHVACLGGELVTLDAASGEKRRQVRLEKDLRDVIVRKDGLLVTRFRSAEMLSVSPEGDVVGRFAPPALQTVETFEPAVAWRAVQASDGSVAMVHQRALSQAIDITVTEESTTGGGAAYGGGSRSQTTESIATFGCDGSIVHAAVTIFPSSAEEPAPPPAGDAPPDEGAPGEGGEGGEDVQPAPPALEQPAFAAPTLPRTVLPVDLAVSPSGYEIAVVAAGSRSIVRTARVADEFSTGSECDPSATEESVPGEPTAIAYAGHYPVVQLREPAALVILDGTNAPISLSSLSVRDTGHDMFHTNPGSGVSLACASCHPEGGDDGRTWEFIPDGKRRTQSLRGGILATAPLHWAGDMGGLDTIMREVFVRRMGGRLAGPRKVRAFGEWLDAMPRIGTSPPSDEAAVARGEALFRSASVGCATCHAGDKLTNNATVDVGTGEPLQVPTLMNIGLRAPYMHDGCATTLRDRFDPSCGGGDQHGRTSHLAAAEIDDLVAYLETL